MDLGAPELLIILVIGLLIFGSNRLPKLARSLGQASKEFKSATTGDWPDVIPTAAADPTAPATPSPPGTPPAHDEPPSNPSHPAG